MREPRQWFLVIAPFVNVLNIVLVVQGFEKLVIATDPLDTEMSKVEKERMNAKSQGNFGDDSIMETAMGFAFPFIMIYGFATCSGITLWRLCQKGNSRQGPSLT
jgi:hypothetical protein